MSPQPKQPKQQQYQPMASTTSQPDRSVDDQGNSRQGPAWGSQPTQAPAQAPAPAPPRASEQDQRMQQQRPQQLGQAAGQAPPANPSGMTPPAPQNQQQQQLGPAGRAYYGEPPRPQQQAPAQYAPADFSFAQQQPLSNTQMPQQSMARQSSVQPAEMMGPLAGDQSGDYLQGAEANYSPDAIAPNPGMDARVPQGRQYYGDRMGRGR
jgi:hypothetical protein